MRKIRCEKADFAEFAALPTKDRQFVIPNMFSIENRIINVEVATENYISKFEEFTIEDFSHAMAIQNRRLRFARLNVFGLCRCLTVLIRSGKSKRDSNAVSGC